MDVNDDGMLGRRKSSDGLVWKFLLGASWTNARAAEEGLECASWKQLLVIDRVAMFVLKGKICRSPKTEELEDVDCGA